MKIVHNCNLAPYNAYNLGARCTLAYFPESSADILALMEGQLQKCPYVLLGSGHNVILARALYETPFVIFNGNLGNMTHNGTMLTAGAGAFTHDVCEYALANGLRGLEVFYDIPSSIGGAVCMNAGAYDEEIASILHSATFWDAQTRSLRTLPAQELGLTYRNSIFQQRQDRIVLSATFMLQPDQPENIRRKMQEIKARRWASQPRALPNAGSVFKRPQGRYVGPMLDELNLKGHHVQGFRVSPQHSGFIEKIGPGTGADLLALIQDIQHRVRQAFNVELELEQRLIDAP